MQRARADRILFALTAVLAGACEKGTLSGPGGGGQIGPASGAGASGDGGAGASGASGFPGVGGAIGSGAGGSVGPRCGAEVPAPAIALDVLILLGASASMNDDTNNTACSGGCGPRSKWARITAAINAVTATTEASTNWGLDLFPLLNISVEGDSSTCDASLVPFVAVGARQARWIAQAIANRTSANGGVYTGGSTPTRAAVMGAAEILANVTDGNRKLILLVTDGAPDCAVGTGGDDRPATVDAITSAEQMGISTAVVGVATSGGPADPALNRMAVAGGHARPAAPYYYAVTDTGDTDMAMRAIVAASSRCLFAVPPPADPNNDRSHIGVRVDGLELPRDTSHANGWDYTDATMSAVQLFGPACDTTTVGFDHVVQIIYKCLL